MKISFAMRDILLVSVILGSILSARTLHVGGPGADDAHTGLDPSKPLASIQRATDMVEPGDRVLVAPGIYFEHVKVTRKGTADGPILFTVAPSNRGRVIVSGSDPRLRAGQVDWKLEDAALGLYSIPFTHRPVRLTVDGGDLFPYDDLAGLKTFRTWLDGKAVGYPGPFQGFAYDREGRKLYVRLHGTGRYGKTDPAGRRVSTSPTFWAGKGEEPGMGPDYGFRLEPKEEGAPMFMTVEGFVFENTAQIGVHVKGSRVTVRHCRFEGVRVGVVGNRTAPDRPSADGITVEYCEYHQWPAFDDMVEVIEKYADDPWRGARTNLNQKIYWWQRKNKGTGKWQYETGIAANAGKDWRIRRNHIHDAFEALCGGGGLYSEGLVFEENLVERIIDNAFETEDHSQGFTARSNMIRDTFEPFSWQPLDGEPWPGSILIEGNRYWCSPALTRLWKTGHTPGIFKIGQERAPRPAKEGDPWVPAKASGTGFLARGNLVFSPDHQLFTVVQSWSRGFEGFRFESNVFAVATGGGGLDGGGRGLVFANNTVLFSQATSNEAIQRVAAGGKTLDPLAAGETSAETLKSVMGPHWLGAQQGWKPPILGVDCGPDFRSGREPGGR